MQNVKLLVGIVVGTVVLVLGVALVFSGESKPQSYDGAMVMGGRAHVKIGGGGGDGGGEASESAQTATPRVSLVEFSDFQCPACRASQPMVEQVLADFGSEVELVFRHYPLTGIHKNAMAAAVAAEAADQMGAFWEYHDTLFEKQDEWAELDDPEEKFVEYAKDLGLDEVRFGEWLDSGEMAGLVQKDVTDGNSLGVNATPTFFVNGVKVGDGDVYRAVARALNE